MKKILLVSSFFPLSALTLILAFSLLIGLEVSKINHDSQAAESENTHELNMPDAASDLASQKESVRVFITRYKSPLGEYADYIVDVSHAYGIDFRLIPAIAMQESNLCKKAPVDSHNCWGYGIYGEKITRFSNYKEAIERVAFTLSQNYVKKGYSTVEQIMSIYTPRNTNNWAAAVTHFMAQME